MNAVNIEVTGSNIIELGGFTGSAILNETSISLHSPLILRRMKVNLNSALELVTLEQTKHYTFAMLKFINGNHITFKVTNGDYNRRLKVMNFHPTNNLHIESRVSLWFVPFLLLSTLIVVSSFLALKSEVALTKESESNVKVSPDNFQVTRQPQETRVYLDDLLEIYEENELRGDNKFRGKYVKFTSIVKDLGRDTDDNIYIIFTAEDSNTRLKLKALFSESESDSIGRLDIGDKIRATCKISRKYYYYYLMADDCTSGGRLYYH